ncbi:uncharacterized protein HKW66_Vig0201350 [Vigna angularis]|uniref:Uncharacterized protein n=1 Tax=Phaseolus angularis TaxID=3914 RepID=A0A8T0JSM3_PHAAN|nr:uncharacterized protein HKW66_Vig0201350 [Vigna angularis]
MLQCCRSKKIENLFQKKDICWEWFLRGNPIIRATLHLDEGPIPENGVHEFGMGSEEVVMKRIEDNQRKMVEMNKELRTLAAMVGDGKEEREHPSFFEEGGTCVVDADGEADDGEGDDGKADDGHVDDGVDEEAQCLETVSYTDAGGCLEEKNEDVEDILMLYLL